MGQSGKASEHNVSSSDCLLSTVFCTSQRVFDWIASGLGSIWSTKSFVVMGHVRVIAGTLTVRYGVFMDGFCPINFPKSTKTQRKKTNNASEICCFSAHFLAFTLETALSVVHLYVYQWPLI